MWWRIGFQIDCGSLSRSGKTGNRILHRLHSACVRRPEHKKRHVFGSGESKRDSGEKVVPGGG